MKMTISKTDLANPTIRNTFVKFVDGLKHGGFMHVSGFAPKHGYGEVQNGTFQKGIDYGNSLTRSLEQLDTIASNPDYQLEVTRGAWVNEKGEESPSARKSKLYPTYTTITSTLTHADAILADAIAKVRDDIQRSIDGNTKPSVDYVQLGNGIYAHPETDVLYLRDLRRINKQIVIEGNYPNTASKPVNAIADTLKRQLSVGNYRMFRCDADYDSITIDGVTIEHEASESETLSVTESVPTSASENVPEPV